MSKWLIIFAEVEALVCQALLIIMCTTGETEFDAPKALAIFLFTIYAIILQSVQQNIDWKDGKKE